MPVQLSYPGVYVEEIPSSVRTIASVATSVGAFIGFARRGPTGRAVRCLSFSDFERAFGGLDGASYLGYAVAHFFGNGGSQCWVVRLAADDAKTAKAAIEGLEVLATGPGEWANSYQLVATPRAAPNSDKFRLDVVAGKDIPGVAAKGAIFESYNNLSLDSLNSRYVAAVLAEESDLIVVDKVDPTKPINTAATADLKTGADGAVISPGDDAFTAAVAAGFSALAKVDFNLLNVPGFTDAATLQALQKFCRDRRAMLLVDTELDPAPDPDPIDEPPSGLSGGDSINSAIYYPWILAPDPQQQQRIRAFPPGGAVAGVYARTDAARGVWKAPAGTDASLSGVVGVAVKIDDAENGILNPLAVNCIRRFPIYGTIVWGARTLQGADEAGSEWKYVPVRRTALFIEESLYRGLKWVVFEPNDEPLWAQIRLNVGSFMNDLFRQGAFQGTTPKDAYFVKCDKDTTTQSDINKGVVNIVVGFAPLKPAEFVVIKLQQLAGQLAT